MGEKNNTHHGYELYHRRASDVAQHVKPLFAMPTSHEGAGLRFGYFISNPPL